MRNAGKARTARRALSFVMAFVMAASMLLGSVASQPTAAYADQATSARVTVDGDKNEKGGASGQANATAGEKKQEATGESQAVDKNDGTDQQAQSQKDKDDEEAEAPAGPIEAIGKFFQGIADGVGKAATAVVETVTGTFSMAVNGVKAMLSGESGRPYAVYCYDGVLRLIRSESNTQLFPSSMGGAYQSWAEGGYDTLQDTDGNTYSGQVWSFEDANAAAPWNEVGYNHISKTAITSVVSSATQPITPARCTNWFKDFTSLTSVDLSGVTIVGGATDMTGIFSGCSSLSSIAFGSQSGAGLGGWGDTPGGTWTHTLGTDGNAAPSWVTQEATWGELQTLTDYNRGGTWIQTSSGGSGGSETSTNSTYAYAVYVEADNTLLFFNGDDDSFFRPGGTYDSSKEGQTTTITDLDGEQHTGKMYSFFSYSEPWRNDANDGNINVLHVDCADYTKQASPDQKVPAPSDCTGWFDAFRNSLLTADLSGIDFRGVQDTSGGMFSTCEHVTDIKLDGADFGGISNGDHLVGCISGPRDTLETISFRGANLSTAYANGGMTLDIGESTSALTSVDFEGATLPASSGMGYFYGLSSLQRVDFKNTDMSGYSYDTAGRGTLSFLDCPNLVCISFGSGLDLGSSSDDAYIDFAQEEPGPTGGAYTGYWQKMVGGQVASKVTWEQLAALGPEDKEGLWIKEGADVDSLLRDDERPQASYGSLTVGKTVTGTEDPAVLAQSFSFTVTLGNGWSGEHSGVSFQNGAATLSLSNGQTKTITDIEAGTTYEVSETAAENFTPSWTGDSRTGAIAANQEAQVTCTNAYVAPPTAYNIPVTKAWDDSSDAAAARPDELTFYVLDSQPAWASITAEEAATLYADSVVRTVVVNGTSAGSGANFVPSVATTDGNQWYFTVEDLPINDEVTGNPISYYLAERRVPGYKSENANLAYNGNNVLSMTNAYQEAPEATTLTVNRVDAHSSTAETTDLTLTEEMPQGTSVEALVPSDFALSHEGNTVQPTVDVTNNLLSYEVPVDDLQTFNLSVVRGSSIRIRNATSQVALLKTEGDGTQAAKGEDVLVPADKPALELTLAASGDGDPELQVEGSITIAENGTVNSGTTYDAYRVFQGEVTTTNGQDKASALSWDANAPKAAILSFLDGNGYGSWLTGDGHASPADHDNPMIAAQFISERIATSDTVVAASGTQPRTTAADSFANGLARVLVASGTPAAGAATSGVEYFDEQGYYLFVTNTGTIGSTEEAGTAPIWAPISGTPKTVTEKVAVPTLTSQVRDDADGAAFGKAADGNIAQPLAHRLTATMPANIEAYPSYAMTIAESLPSGMSLSGNDTSTVAVSLGGTDVTSLCAITYENDVLTVSAPNILGVDGVEVGPETTLVIDYRAVLDADATVGPDGNSTSAVLTYTADPHDASATSQVPQQSTITYAHVLSIEKLDRETRLPLAGAQFTIQDDASGMYVAADGTLSSSAVNHSTDVSTGLVVVSGVDSGSYTIAEVSAPAGYKTVANTTLTISPTYDAGGAIDTYGVSASGENFSDVVAPATTVGANEDGVSVADASLLKAGVRISDLREIVLPLTGMPLGMGIAVYGSMLLAISLAVYIRNKRIKDQIAELEKIED